MDMGTLIFGHDDVAALIWLFLSKKSIGLCVLLNSLWLERAENYCVSVGSVKSPLGKETLARDYDSTSRHRLSGLPHSLLGSCTIASPAPPLLEEWSNLNHPLRDMFMTATRSLSNHFSHF